MTDEELSRSYTEALHLEIMQEQQQRPLLAMERINLLLLDLLKQLLEECE